jgi:hypothetical protein
VGTIDQLGISDPTPLDPATNNAWGPIVNDNNGIYTAAIIGNLTLDVSTGPIIVLTNTPGLPGSQAGNQHYRFNGTLTQNVLILWPQGVFRFFSVLNATSGAFTMSLGADDGTGHAAGTPFVLAQGSSLLLFSNGTIVQPVENSSSILNTVNTWTAAQDFNAGVTFTGASDVTLDPAQTTISTYSVGYRGLPSQFKNANYTIVASDGGTKLVWSSASNGSITIGGQAFHPSVDSEITIINPPGTATVTVVQSAGVTLVWLPAGGTGTRTIAHPGIAFITQQANTDVWYIWGFGIT